MQTNMEPLVEALIQGNKDRSVQEAIRLLQEGVPIETIVQEGIEAAMLKMDAKCTMDDFNLLEIMLVGRAAMEVMKVIVPVGVKLPTSKGSIVLATPEGDVHDLGKNIVKMVLTGKGYRVIDRGKDCPLEQIVSSAVQENADAIGVSGLITTVIPTVRTLRPSLRDAGIENITLIAGGAAMRQASAEELNVDYVAMDVFDGARFLASSGGT